MKAALLAILVTAAAASASQAPFAAPSSASVQVDLSQHLNNKGTSRAGLAEGVGIRNGSSFPSEFLPTGLWTDNGVTFSFPAWDEVEVDNVRCGLQVVDVGGVEIGSVHLIGTGEDPGGG